MTCQCLAQPGRSSSNKVDGQGRLLIGFLGHVDAGLAISAVNPRQCSLRTVDGTKGGEKRAVTREFEILFRQSRLFVGGSSPMAVTSLINGSPAGPGPVAFF